MRPMPIAALRRFAHRVRLLCTLRDESPGIDLAGMAATSRRVCELHRVQVHVEGPLPTQGPTVFVANHLSYLDPLAIVAQSPALAIAKHEVARWPLVGSILERRGVMFVRRGDALSGARTLRRAMAHLDEGHSILAFPEGTTTSGDRVLPFHRGVFGIALRCRVPVVPIAITMAPELAWVGDEAFLPHYLRTMRRSRLDVYLRYLPPVSAPGGAVRDEAAWRAEAARQAIANTILGNNKQ